VFVLLDTEGTGRISLKTLRAFLKELTGRNTTMAHLAEANEVEECSDLILEA
jgi:Ca2+-binding EF-hand superfamily protein